MSVKAARGTKRLCQSCGSKFYDLNRDPIICPLCGAQFVLKAPALEAAAGGNSADEDDDVSVAPALGGVELVSLDEVAADEDDIPDIEEDDLPDIDSEDDGLKSGGDEAFLEDEEDGDADVTGIIGGPISGEDEV